MEFRCAGFWSSSHHVYFILRSKKRWRVWLVWLSSSYSPAAMLWKRLGQTDRSGTSLDTNPHRSEKSTSLTLCFLDVLKEAVPRLGTFNAACVGERPFWLHSLDRHPACIFKPLFRMRVLEGNVENRLTHKRSWKRKGNSLTGVSGRARGPALTGRRATPAPRLAGKGGRNRAGVRWFTPPPRSASRRGRSETV